MVKAPLCLLACSALAVSCQGTTVRYRVDAASEQAPAPGEPLEKRVVQVDLELWAQEGDGAAALGELLSEPRLTVFGGQSSTLSVADSTSYVERFALEQHGDGAWIADPVVAELKHGLFLELTPHYCGGGRWGGRVSVEMASLHGFTELQAELLPGVSPVTIQLPNAESHRRVLALVPNDANRWSFDLGPMLAGGRRALLRVSMAELVITPPLGK